MAGLSAAGRLAVNRGLQSQHSLAAAAVSAANAVRLQLGPSDSSHEALVINRRFLLLTLMSNC